MMQSVKGWPGFLLTAALLILVFSYLASHSDAPTSVSADPVPAAPPPTSKTDMADSRPFMKRLGELAHKTKGDWSQVPPQDQEVLDGYSNGHGRDMFSMMAKQSDTPSKKSKKGK